MSKPIVESIEVNSLIRYVIKSLAGLGLTDIYDFLSVDDEDIDGWEIMDTILEDSISRFDYYEPLDIKLWCYIEPNKPYEFIDNFDEYLEGIVPRTGLSLIPRKIVSIIDIHLGTLRNILYEPPMLLQHSLAGTNIFNCFCNRPVRKTREGEKYTPESRIYYLSKHSSPRLTRFKQLFLLNVISHITRLNENLDHPNMPLGTFQGLVNYRSELESKVAQDFEISHGYYGVYSK